MTTTEILILKNQIEIMWALNYLLSKTAPDLVGRGGELDSFRYDLSTASKNTRIFIEENK